MLKFWNGSKGVGKNKGHTRFLCDGVPYPGKTTRIISSEDLDIVLAGSIKVCVICFCCVICLELITLFFYYFFDRKQQGKPWLCRKLY
jgi:hypothetical protein